MKIQSNRPPFVSVTRCLDKRAIHALPAPRVASEKPPNVIAVGHVVILGDRTDLVQIGMQGRVPAEPGNEREGVNIAQAALLSP